MSNETLSQNIHKHFHKAPNKKQKTKTNQIITFEKRKTKQTTNTNTKHFRKTPETLSQNAKHETTVIKLRKLATPANYVVNSVSLPI